MKKTLTVFLFFLCLAGIMAQNGRPSVALVLGGGAARGFAHVAVLELIEEMNIPVDMITGVSSGAIIGGLYAVGYTPTEIMEALDGRDWTSFFQDRPVSPFGYRNEELPLAFRLGGSRAIAPDWVRGYSTGQKAYELFKSLTINFPSYIDFDSLPIPFRAGAVEIPAGKFELLSKGDLAEAIRASMSIQGVFEPFVIEGKSYVDGGLLNNLPIRDVKAMGYDIIIAVDLFATPHEFHTGPMDLPDLMTVLYSSQMGINQYDLADVVLHPLSTNVSPMDFSKGREILAMAEDEKERLRGLLEPIREKIAFGSSDGASNGRPRGKYKEMLPLTPQKVIIEGALSRDQTGIEKHFSRLVKGRALGEENINAFLESIYETGNYHMALVRTDTRSGEVCLEIVLYSERVNKLLFRVGFDYEGTFSSQSSVRAALRNGLEFREKNGFSILLKASVMDEINLGLSLFQPLGSHFFLTAETDLVRDQQITIMGILSKEETAPIRLFYYRAALRGGLLINKNNSLSLGPEYHWFGDQDNSCAIAGLAADYTYSNLDNIFFPSRGSRVRLENRLRFYPADSVLFDLVSVDLTSSIPMDQKFSFITSFFGSFIIGSPGIPPEYSTFDLENVRRIYFPHALELFTGEKRAAVSLSLQFVPQENLSLIGGRLIFLLTGTIGFAGSFEWNEWDNYANNLVWNASFGTALLPTRNFGLQIRAGAGGGGGNNLVPFVSLDMGMSSFQKRMF